jgi:hypothetical protein
MFGSVGVGRCIYGRAAKAFLLLCSFNYLYGACGVRNGLSTMEESKGIRKRGIGTILLFMWKYWRGKLFMLLI